MPATTTTHPSIHDLFSSVAAQRASAIAVVAGMDSLTYAELDSYTNRLASHLQQKGVRPGSPVGIMAERSIGAIAAMLAILKAGGGYVPLDPNWPEERLGTLINDASLTLILSESRHLASVPYALSKKLILLDGNAPEGPLRPSPGSENALAYVMYTSGSTGKPKGIAVSHRNVLRLVQDADYIHLGPEEVILQSAQLYFDASTFEIWGALLNGGKLVISPPGTPDPDGLGKLIAQHGVTTAFFTAGLFHRIAEDHINCFRPLRQLLAGGDVLYPRLVRKVLEEVEGITIINGYGPTENTTFTCCHPMTRANPPADYVPIGRPIAGTTVFILDIDLKLMPIDEVGEICAGGRGVALGYLNLPELTAERFIPDPFSQERGARLYRTGDFGRQHRDGTIEFLGRRDRQVKVRGYRIELDEIEVALSQQDDVGQVAITTHDFSPEDRRLIAYYTSSKQTPAFAKELRAFLASKLPDFMIPHHFFRLEKFQLTPNGKLDREKLPAPEILIALQDKSVFVSATETEQTVANLMAETLRCRSVGPDDNFFALGGHSLTACMLMARLNKKFGVDIPLRNFFAAPTSRAVAEIIDQTVASNIIVETDIPLEPTPGDQDELPQSFPQQGLWFLDQLASAAPGYILPFAFRVQGSIDLSILQSSLDTIILRHEALRTTFPTKDSLPIQRINPAKGAVLNAVDFSSAECPQEMLDEWIHAEVKTGFDLASGPLLKAYLIRLAEAESIFFFLVHHIVFDGWSLNVFLRELNTCYEAYSRGDVPQLPRLPLQYRDFTLWQLNPTRRPRINAQLRYWKQALAGELPLSNLPTDHQRPATLTFNGALIQREIAPDLYEKLASLAVRSEATVFMVLAAALAVLLFRYSGQRDIMYGCPAGGRGRPELEGIIGFFVNTLPLRFRLDGNPSFSEFLKQSRDIILTALEHQDAPFELIVETVNPPRLPNRTPLVQTFFSYLDVSDNPDRLGDLNFRQIHIDPKISRTDLTVLAFRRCDRIEIVTEYNSDLFDSGTMERMMDHFLNLLENLPKHPNSGIENLSLMTEEERRRILFDWNQTVTDFPRSSAVHTLFRQQALEAPDRLALVWDGGCLSYGELERRSNHLAHRLINRGVKPGMRVAVFLDRSSLFIDAVLGIFKAGGVYVPLDPAYPEERINFMLRDSAAGIILTEQKLIGLIPAGTYRTMCLDASATPMTPDYPDSPPAVPSSAESPAYVMYTSGSTGTPKGVVIPHRGIVRLVKNTNYVTLCSKSVLLQHSPVSFDASTFEIWGALLNGGTLAIPPAKQLSAEELGCSIKKWGITTLWLSAGLFHAIAEENLLILQPLKKLIVGGDVLSLTALRKAHHELPQLTIINGYGPTENTTFTCCHTFTWLDIDGARAPIGRPIANTRVYILDRHREPVPVGVVGELYAAGDGLALGYINRPELNEKSFVPDPFWGPADTIMYKTGDFARFLPDGTIDLLGRSDDQVKIRGYRIELGEIEQAVAAFPGVSQAAAACFENECHEKYLMAYFVPATGNSIHPAEVMQFIQNRLPPYMLPRGVVHLDTLPINENGKLNRKLLPRWRDASPTTSPPIPLTATEQMLSSLWMDLLGCAEVDPEADFFALGGHSLLAVRLFAKINKRTQHDLPLATLFKAPTIRSLAKILDSLISADSVSGANRHGIDSEGWRSLVPIQPNGNRPPLFLVHAVGGNVLNYQILLQSLGNDQPVFGLQARGLDGILEPFTSIEEIAAQYLAEIRTIQQQGHFFLGGASFGGVVALEIAQQLNRLGEKVPFLAMFDTPGPGKRGYRQMLRQDRSILLQTGDRLLRLLCWLYRTLGHAIALNLRLWYIRENHRRALAGYSPVPYSGPITLFRTATGSSKQYVDPRFGWEAIARGGLKIIPISASHETFLEAPELGALFTQELRKAQQRTSPGARTNKPTQHAKSSTTPFDTVGQTSP